MTLNKRMLAVKRIRVGDLVITDYEDNGDATQYVQRRVVEVVKHKRFGCGIGIRADGGAPCPCCHRSLAKPTPLLDGVWFVSAAEWADRVLSQEQA